jgi:MFS family permease
LAVPSARVWGKRHLLILGTVLLIGTSAWGGASRSYNSLLAARIFQGFGTAPFEALVNAAVGDLYFVHVGSPFPAAPRRIPSNRPRRNAASAWL